MATASPDYSELDEPVSRRRSTFGVVRDVLLSMTRVVEDSTELIGASVHEELAQFRVDLAKHMLGVVAVVTGVALGTAGLASLVSELVGSWPLTLLLFGGVYLVGGVGLLWRDWREDRDSR